MPSTTYAQIREAVRGRKPIKFKYGGKLRRAVPVILGYSKDGREALSAYQTGGETSPGKKLPGWRCFYLFDVREVSFSDGVWLEGDSHKQPQSCVEFTDVDVNLPETLIEKEPVEFGSPKLRLPRGSARR
jgi:hypothetical protein